MAETRRFTVVAAVIADGADRVLMTQRPEGRHMAGLWEFPGGKLRPDEAPEEALRRELAEELGVEAAIGAPITFAVHREPGLEILLLFFAADILAGTPEALDGQKIRWLHRSELNTVQTPPADRDLIAALSRSETPQFGHDHGL